MRSNTHAGQSVGPLDIYSWNSIFYLFLATTALTYTSFVPKLASYALVVVGYGILVVLGLNRGMDTLNIPTYALWALGVIWSLYLVNLGMSVVAGDVQVAMLIRVPAFIIFTGLNLFFLPNLIPRRVYFTALSSLATIFVLLAIPTLFVPQYSVGPIQIEHWGSTFQVLPGSGMKVHALKSIFRNPNTLSFIAAVGFIAALGAYVERGDKRSKVQLGILATGLYLAHGRAAIGAAVIGVLVIVAYDVYSPQNFRRLAVLGLIFGVCGFLAVSGLVSVPGPIPTINLQGRIELWKGGVRAVAHRPLLGYGPGDTGELIAPFVDKYVGYNPHNSYLRMSVTTGLFGGTAYVFLVSKVVFDQFIRPMSTLDATLFALCVVVTLIQFFAAFSLFGLSLTSVVTSLAYGYGIHAIVAETDHSKGALENI